MRGFFCSVAALCLVTGCATRREVERLEAEVHDVRAQLEQRGSGAEAGSAADDEIAELELRLSKLESWAEKSQDHALGLAKKVDEIQGDVGPGNFQKGDKARSGMSPLEIRQHAIAQGDPHSGHFSLTDAFAGDPQLSDRSLGPLVATFTTTAGRFDCVLHEEQAPNTVANFVGLARGVRSWIDPASGTWHTGPLYDGTLFHRVIADFMIQGGDPLGTGRGEPGYVLEDEIDPGLVNKTGALAMANRGKNTAGSQFFIVVKTAAHLDGKHTVFGQCAPKVPKQISKVAVDPRRQHRPLQDVTVVSVKISRGPR